MKKTKFLVGACLAFMLAGCSDDDVVKTEVTLPVSGDEITFGASTKQFSGTASRTVYGEPADYQDYEELSIDWKPGQDQVRVYSPQASSECQSADYTVQEDASASAPAYYLQKNSEIGVRWGDTNTDHDFYAFYPLTVDDATGGTASIRGLQNNTTVSATIPTAQERGQILERVNNGTTWKVVTPNMTYCMMAGQGTWTPGTDKNVALTFKPIVLVLDVVVNASDTDIPDKVLGVTVRSKNQPIVGSFDYDIASDNFTFTSEADKDDYNQAYVDCQENGEPLTLNAGEKLNVKFFLLPQDIKAGELTVSVILESGKTISQALVPGGGAEDGEELIHGEIIKVRTPKINTAQPSNWMSLIGNDVLFASQLSLPGTKYSYTYTQYNNEQNNYDSNSQIMRSYQTLNIGEQFDAGIRAFDIKVNTGGNGNDHEAYIYVNGEDLRGENGRKQTLGNMLSLLKEKLDAAPTEFVIISINWVDNGRTANQWVSDIATAVQTWSDWNPRRDNPNDGSTLNNGDDDYFREVVSTTTVGIMRHGIGIMIHAPESYNGGSATNLNIITNYSSSVQNTSLVENVIENDRGNGDIHIQNLQQMNNPRLGIYPYYITEDYALKQTGQLDLIQTKKGLIEELFTLSKTNNTGNGENRTNNLYVNDLGGFCVVNNNMSTGWADATKATCTKIITWYNWVNTDIKLKDYREKDNYTYFRDSENGISWNRPSASSSHENETSLDITGRDNVDKGEGGNNALLAEEINGYAADLIYNLVNEGRTPLGVVYMNFAGTSTVTFDREYTVRGIRLPSLIMTNNFKFPLATATSSSN